MMAGGGDGLLKRVPPVCAEKQANIPPGFVVVQAIQTVAGTDARFAAGAFVQIDFKRVLLSGSGWSGRKQAAINWHSGWNVAVCFGQGKLFDRGQPLLFVEQLVNQRPGFL
jgi:hypothetical protein